MIIKLLRHIVTHKKTATITLLSLLSVISLHLSISMRESVILSIKQGASFIPFIKTYITLPCNFAIGALYLFLQRKFGTVKTYTVINLSLLSYFTIFSLILLPNYDFFTLNSTQASHYKTMFPFARFFIGIAEHWPCALFHVTAEIWGIYIFTILFWQVANETFTNAESEKYYPIIASLIGVGATIASLIIEQIGRTKNPSLTFLSCLVPLSVFMNLIVIYVNKNWKLEKERFNEVVKPQEKDLSLIKKIRAFFDNTLPPKILFLSLCLFSFNFLMCLFETSFWARVSNQYSSQQEILSFFSTITLYKGLFGFVCGLLNVYLVEKIGWKAVLKIMPVVCIFSVHLFFLSSLPPNLLPSLSPFLTLNENGLAYPITITWFFALCMAFSYASKFSFFDPAKEIIISKLPPEERLCSKVFTDGLSGRSGKIMGSIIQSLLLSFSMANSILDLSSFLFFLSVLVSTVFIISVSRVLRATAPFVSEESLQSR